MNVATNNVPRLMGMLLIQKSQQFRVSIGGQEFLVSIEVAQSGNEPASYDANGNTLTAGNTTNTYDFQNHLIRSVDGSGNVTTMVYDGDGHRVSQTVNGVTTQYLIDDRNPTGYAQVVEEIQNGQVVRVYVYGNDLVAQVSNPQSPVTDYFAYDGHGSTRFLTAASGAVVERYNFDAFGILLPDANGPRAPPLTNYLYSGEKYDPNLQLYHLGARDLNPLNDRFETMDSYAGNNSDPQSLHRYAAFWNHGVNKSDPTGKWSLIEILVVVLIIYTLQPFFKPTLLLPRLKGPTIVNISVNPTGMPHSFDAPVVKQALQTQLSQRVFNNLVTGDSVGIKISVDATAPAKLGWNPNKSKYTGRVNWASTIAYAYSPGNDITTIDIARINTRAAALGTDPGTQTWVNFLAHEMIWLNVGNHANDNIPAPDYEISSGIQSFSIPFTVNPSSRLKLIGDFDLKSN